MASDKPPQPRLTLEEKIWIDKRRSDIQMLGGAGGVAGLGIGALVTTMARTSPRMKVMFMVGTGLLGLTSGYLYADNQALNRLEDLSAHSRLRKDYQQMTLEKKAGRKATT